MILYEIVPDASRLGFDPSKAKSEPHVDGIVGSIKSTIIDLVMNQMQQMMIHPSATGQATASTISTI
jgi:hypothetical protein